LLAGVKGLGGVVAGGRSFATGSKNKVPGRAQNGAEVAADSGSVDPSAMKIGMVVGQRCKTSEEVEALEAASMQSGPVSVEFRDADGSVEYTKSSQHIIRGSLFGSLNHRSAAISTTSRRAKRPFSGRDRGEADILEAG
jgi:hypothetical protein